jgi:signal peptidase I
MTSDRTPGSGSATIDAPGAGVSTGAEPALPPAANLAATMALGQRPRRLPVAAPVRPMRAVLPPGPVRRRPRLRCWFAGQRFALDVLLGATLMVLVHLFVVQISVVKGHSMEPSLLDGDRLVVDRIAYSLARVQRGDVVVLRYPRNPQVDFVKRVVGLPGDRVAMRDGRVFVNGEVFEPQECCIQDHEDLTDQIVPEGSYFVLGDNRPISCDSREFGLVAAELLKGRVRVRFWPLDRLAVF